MRAFLSKRLPFLAVVLMAAALTPAAVTARSGQTAKAELATANIDLAPVLAEDGTFVGAQGVSGSVDTSKWTLVSDLSSPEPPRFGPATAAAAITPGAWSALGCCWDGNAASAAIVSHVYAIAVSGTNIYVAGIFFNAGGVEAADFIAKWNGSAWSALPNGSGGAPITSGRIDVILVSGTNVYVGGDFANLAGDAQADDVAVWTGTNWSDVAGASSGDGALNGEIYALAINGSNLYIGGYFYNAPALGTFSPHPGDMILRWDGSWHWVGTRTGFDGAIQGTVYALLATPDGVIAGGAFQNVGDTTVDYLAEYRLDTGLWTAFHGAVANSYVRAFAQSGNNVYLGGEFLNFNNIPEADFVVQWTGSDWVALANGLNAHVYSIALSGSNVYVGGNFLDAGVFQTADKVARWNGSAWAPLGSNGFSDGPLNWNAADPAVYALATASNALYAGGTFQDGGGILKADYLAAYGIGATTNQKPDGRIKKGSGSLVGNNIFNSTGDNQTRSGSAAVGSTITFTVSIQNDGSNAGKFKVAATASGNVNYEVTYWRGTTNITAAVVAGTYTTGKVSVGNAFAIKAKVKVLAAATAGSSATRLVTITSASDVTKVDAVKLIGMRS